MDDTTPQGPPAPADYTSAKQQPTHPNPLESPVTLAPAPSDSSVTSPPSVPMQVPDFARQLQTQPSALAVVPGWREQLPLASLAMLAGALLIGWSLWQRRRLTRAAATRTSAAQLPTVAESRQLQRDVAELTEKLAHQLDVRAARLESLLEQADTRIATLEKLLAAKPPAITIEPKLSPAPLAGLDAPPLAHRDVYALADDGLSPVQIAQRTGKPTGQIELILQLRRAMTASTR
jgi:hypothetical protein